MVRNFVKCQSGERQHKGPLTSASVLEDSVIKMLMIGIYEYLTSAKNISVQSFVRNTYTFLNHLTISRMSVTVSNVCMLFASLVNITR